MKKVVSIIISIGFILSSFISIAAESSISSDLVDQTAKLIAGSDLYPYVSGQEAYLGERLLVYKSTNSGIIDLYPSQEYYPLYSGENVIGIISVSKDEDAFKTYTLSPSFANDMNKIQKITNQFAIIYKDTSVIIVTANEIESFGEIIQDLTLEEKLNKYGSDGWELVGVLEKPATGLGNPPESLDRESIVFKKAIKS